MSGMQRGPQSRMPLQRGPMGQVAGGEKAKSFGPSAKRLLATLRTDMPLLVVVLVFSVLSVGLSVIGPKLLGNATNVVFAGFVSLQVPSGVTKERFGSVKRHYVHCDADQAITPAGQALMVKMVDEAMGSDTTIHRLSASHSPFLSQPEQVAEILLGVAG